MLYYANRKETVNNNNNNNNNNNQDNNLAPPSISENIFKIELNIGLKAQGKP